MGRSSTEALRPTKSLLEPTDIVNIGNWNVRTMHATSNSMHMAKATREYGIHILELSERRWTGSGKLRISTGETAIKRDSWGE